MRVLLLLCLILVAETACEAQNSEVWIRSTERGDERFGFKTAGGKVRMPVRSGRVIADTFHHIIAVETDALRGYYLLKTGRQTARDSLYIIDYDLDCESEGMIRFHDSRTDRMGFLDSNGDVAIPAVYNSVSPFYNGFALAYRNGRRKCADADSQNCEHWFWAGGETVLINKANKVLATGLTLDYRNLNWYSAELNSVAPDTSVSMVIPGIDGNSYTFADYEKEFTGWLQQRFLPALRTDSAQVSSMLFGNLVYWSEASGWKTLSKAAFQCRFPPVQLRAMLRDERLATSEIMDEELNAGIYEAPAFRRYFTSCGRPFRELYPAFTLVITHRPGNSDHRHKKTTDPNDFVQDHFEFLRTETGYRLIGVSIVN